MRSFAPKADFGTKSGATASAAAGLATSLKNCLRFVSSIGTPIENIALCLFLLDQGPPECRERGAVITAQVITFATIGHRSDENRFPRAEVIGGLGLGQFLVEVAFDRHKVEYRGGEPADLAALLMCHVASHREGFQINLRSHYSGAEA